MNFIIIWYLVYFVLCASWFAWFSLALINVLVDLSLSFMTMKICYFRWVTERKYWERWTFKREPAKLQFLNVKHFLWLEHAFDWSSGYFIHYFGICCVPWFWVRIRCQTYILTFKEEVKWDIDEGVRVSSLMISVGIIS